MGSEALTKVYEPREAEARWYQYWLDHDFFHAADRSPKKPFSIVIPPPNVTGMLHMGHALNNVLQDIMIRYRRMQGCNALWMPGMDHAGIATQNVVEQELAKEGLTRHDLGREKFIERVWQWKAKYGGVIIHQLKRLGCSCDWARERFTMDEGLSRAVREVFVRLYHDGLIYQGDYIVNWCPRCRTAISDLEVEYHQEAGHLWNIFYPFAEGEGGVVVATTRPETMLGDTAVAVHPDDDRYKAVVGKEVILPLMNRRIPIIADDYVTMEFGSGAVKITPASDPADFAMAGRHGLPIIKIMDDNAVINENGGAYQGQDRYKARQNVVADLEKGGWLRGIEPYSHNVGQCYRCKTDIEPAVSRQWFVKIAPLAKEAIAAVVKGKTRIVPPSWEATYFEWMNNIRDWCISRQIWWGHRIPVWTCEGCGKLIVASQDPDRCPDCGGAKLRQEEDVLDTWFSSGLWPFSTLGWPENTEALKTFYPTSLLVTGFDILFFWVARMMMMGLKFRGDVPFRDVYIHALVRDAEGQKMSKSRGNVVDPLLVMEKYGTDAFRFTLAAFAAQGRDVRLSEDRLAGYRNFANKIWNASRFTLSNLADFDPGKKDDGAGLTLADRWILSRMNRIVDEVRQGLDAYKFNEAASSIYQFLWHEFCDWYIELSKPALYQDESPARKSLTQKVLVRVLDTSLRLLHPFMPFLTEEIWQSLPGNEGSIMVADFPRVRPEEVQPEVEAEMGLVMNVIGSIRNLRSELNVPPVKEVEVVLYSRNAPVLGEMRRYESYVKTLARTGEIAYRSDGGKPKASATAVVGEIEVFLPLKDLIDLDEEEKRIQKEITKLGGELSRVTLKLQNEDFLAKARPEAVEKEREKSRTLAEKAAKLKEGLGRIQSWKREA